MTGDRSFGAWVHARRRELGFTQKKLARLLGCSSVTVQKIEEGRRRPSPPLAEALARQLNVEPTELGEFLRLARKPPPLARASPAAARLPGPVLPGSVSSGSVPLPLTPLLGREQERAALLEQLVQAPRRLLTLTGPPGVGKTRLALELTHDLLAAFDEVRFVPLAALPDAGQVWPDVARHFGLLPGRAPLGRLGARLRAGRTLLVLDNFEHLLEAAPGVTALLEHAPGLRVLATSREALHVTGEQVWPLAPLPLPPAELQTPEALGHNAAVALFVERATAAWPAFALDADSAAPVAEIVARLGGLPLALELAAGHIGPLSAGELWEALRASPLALLAGGPRDLPGRQQSLQGAVAWSYERLTPELQRGFRRLGVFAGGFTLPAAGALGLRRAELNALLAVNLLRRETPGGRYVLLEPLRAFALARLGDHGEAEAAREAHARYFLGVRDTLAWDDLPWLEAEVGNLRAALHWATGQREALDRYEDVFRLPGEVEPLLRLRTLYCAATPAWQLGLFGQANALLQQCLHLTREAAWPGWEGSILMALGRVALEEGRAGEALAHLHAALPLLREHGDAYNLAAVLTQLTDTTSTLGRLAEACAYAGEGLALCCVHPGLFWQPLLLSLLGELALRDGNVDAARAQLTQALGLAAASAHVRVLTLVLARLACTYAGPAASEAELLHAARLWGVADTDSVQFLYFRDSAGSKSIFRNPYFLLLASARIESLRKRFNRSSYEAQREASAQPFAVPDAQRFEERVQAVCYRLPERGWCVAWEAGRQLDLAAAVCLAVQGPDQSRAARG